MYLSSSEKAAVLRLLTLIIGADNRVDQKELEMTRLFCAKLDITPFEAEQSKCMDNQKALIIASAMTNEEKKIVCALLGVLMIVDGEISEQEHVAWSLISEICEFPKMGIKEADEIVQAFFNE